MYIYIHIHVFRPNIYIYNDNVTKENQINPNWPQIPYHSYRILIIGGCGSGKTNGLLNLIKQQDNDYYSIIDILVL